MKKLFLIAYAAVFATALAACQSSETAQSNINQDNQATESIQNAIAEDMTKMQKMKGSLKESSPDAASAPYDLQFLDTMIDHNQGAIEMAKPVAAKTENAELKAFAAKIIAEQTKQIAQMKNWRKTWFAGKAPAMNMELPGIEDSVKGINMKKMEVSAGKQLDLRFLDMLSKHFEGSLTTSKEALDKAEHTEVKTLANQIIKAQEAEINQMQSWKTDWSQ